MSARGALLLAGVLLLACPGASLAHRLHAEARLQDGQVTLEVYFSDGVTPEGAQVSVWRGEELLAEGLTDARGTWRWRPPGPGTYRLRVSEPGLHKAQVELTVPHAADDPGQRVASSPSGPADDPAHPATRSATGPSPAQPSPGPRGAVPWAGLVVGLGVIAGLGALLALLQRRRGPGGGGSA